MGTEGTSSKLYDWGNGCLGGFIEDNHSPGTIDALGDSSVSILNFSII